MKKTQKQFEDELCIVQPTLKVTGKYINTDTKILVQDTLGIEYLSTPFKLLQKRKPTILSAVDKNKAFSIMATQVHENIYNYNKVNYINSFKKIIISCKKHGDFRISPCRHLSGQGCKLCGRISTGLKRRSNTTSFIERALIIHKNKYDYSQVNYITSDDKVKIICPLHGKFLQIPYNHLQGQGCPKCGNKKISDAAKISSYGWSFTKWKNKIEKNGNIQPRLYVLKCYNYEEKFIKVGITMHEVKKRYPGKGQMPYKFDILFESIDTPEIVYKLEQLIKKEFKKNKIIPKLKFNGMYESYNTNVKNKILNFIFNFNGDSH